MGNSRETSQDSQDIQGKGKGATDLKGKGKDTTDTKGKGKDAQTMNNFLKLHNKPKKKKIACLYILYISYL